MPTPLESLVACGTKLWLDSIDPDLIAKSRKLGATGATSNPIIVGNLIKTGRFDSQLAKLLEQGKSDYDIAWAMDDYLVKLAQDVFLPVWKQTVGNDGYVSFEVDPLLEDPALNMPHKERVSKYIELGRFWSKGHQNRMIKVPATPAGLDALEEMAAGGITLNVTLCFTPRQYRVARDAVWRGAQRRKDSQAPFKSVYSIFVSRVDVYTESKLPQLSPAAQGMVGIVNAKQIWAENQRFWADKKLKLQQEIIFASTGTKKPQDPADKYIEAFAGSDIETNPPSANDQVQALGKSYTRHIESMPPKAVVEEINRAVDLQKMEDYLMEEGIAKFADPQNDLLKLIARKRAAMASAR